MYSDGNRVQQSAMPLPGKAIGSAGPKPRAHHLKTPENLIKPNIDKGCRAPRLAQQRRGHVLSPLADLWPERREVRHGLGSGSNPQALAGARGCRATGHVRDMPRAALERGVILAAAAAQRAGRPRRRHRLRQGSLRQPPEPGDCPCGSKCWKRVGRLRDGNSQT